MNNEQNTANDIETNAIYKITDNPETPADVKKFLLDYLFEKNGISVDFYDVETKKKTEKEIADGMADVRIEQGKALLTEIAMQSGNDFLIIDTLMEIIELFSLKDADISVIDLAEELQTYLFTWTKEYGNSLSHWKQSVISGQKYQQRS
jgi:hypothetical protein